MNIAIDGPAGAGKSTVAKELAKELKYIYVDTGAMYRAIGLYLIRQKVDLDDEAAVAARLPEIDVTIGYRRGVQHVYLNGENVSRRIRTQKVGNAASKTSAYGPVRAKLLDLQRTLAAEHDVIMDGRDIGTVVLPDAELKIFLTASVDVRAERRFLEYQEKGIAADLDTIRKEIEERDYRDSHREIAPLRQAEDAVVVDTSYLTVEEVVASILRLAAEKAGK